MTYEEMRALALSYPGVEEGTSYGHPSFKANGKFLTRLRDEDQSLVLSEVSPDEREMLIEADPQTFHCTPHYKDHPYVLARLERLDEATLRGFLERRWRKVSKKAVVKAWEAGA